LHRPNYDDCVIEKTGTGAGCRPEDLKSLPDFLSFTSITVRHYAEV